MLKACLPSKLRPPIVATQVRTGSYVAHTKTPYHRLFDIENRIFPAQVATLDKDQTVLWYDTIAGLTRPSARPFSRTTSYLLPGHHIFYFRRDDATNKLLEDGTSSVHMPHRDWKFRVFAGGSLSFLQSQAVPLDGSRAILIEKAHDIRVTGPQSDPDRMFITFTRKMYLVPTPDVTNIRHRLMRYNRDSKEYKIPDLSPVLAEDRTLCFSKKQIAMPDSNRIIATPGEAYHSCDIVLSANLVFRFSALTFNAHAIHFDPTYAFKSYGLQKPLVQGQLAMLLMLDVLDSALKTYCAENDLHRARVRRMNYKNLLPIYVGEKVTIRCRKGTDHSFSAPAADLAFENDSSWGGSVGQWQVWIEKSVSSRKTTMCVRASMEVVHYTDRDLLTKFDDSGNTKDDSSEDDDNYDSDLTR